MKQLQMMMNLKYLFRFGLASFAFLISIHLSVAQIHSATSAHTTYIGKSMTGYQGWFGAPGDGGTNGWRHYNGSNGFQPGSATIEYWPDMREADEDEHFETAFTFDNGMPATVFSSVNPKTVNRHFRWMKEYGIDGAFVQRFKSDFGIQSVLTQVMLNAVEAAENNDRAVALMYDIGANIYENGTDSASVAETRTYHVNLIFDDWKDMVDNISLTTRGDDQAYMYHNGKPLVALWGVGFPHRHNSTGLDMEFWVELVDKFKNDPVYGDCSILLGVPTYWREGGGDCISGLEHAKMIDLIQEIDAIMPWHTSRFDRNEMLTFYQSLVESDIAWCNAEGVDYAPNVSPGIREKILHGNGYELPREEGYYMWDMGRAAVGAGAEMLYLGMFDEVDEGTQYHKINNNPPFYTANLGFQTYGDLPEDYYLWLAGEVTRAMRGEFVMEATHRTRAYEASFDSDLSFVDNDSTYEMQLLAAAPGRKVFYADPYKVPDGAPTIGTLRDTCLFPNELTTDIVTFAEAQRGQYIRLVEVDESTDEVISFRAIVATQGYTRVPYATGFESGELDSRYWSVQTENEFGQVGVSEAAAPNNGEDHLVLDACCSNYSTNSADLYVDLSGIDFDVLLSFAYKTFGTEVNPEDGVYFSNDAGETFTKVFSFEGFPDTYQDTTLNINALASAANLSFTGKFVLRFQHRSVDTAPVDGLALDDIRVLFSEIDSGYAQFSASDDQTQGSWIGTYGVDGHYIVEKVDNLPDEVTLTWDPTSQTVVWEDNSTDPRGLQYNPDSTILSARFADSAEPWWFTLDVGEEDTNVSVYFLDGDNQGRKFILKVMDSATGNLYDAQTIQNIENGKWITWNVRGKVRFELEVLEGPNAVVSGIFIAPASPTEIIVDHFLTFDGGDDYVDCGRENSLLITGNQITLEAWFKLDSAQTAIYQSTLLAMDHSEPGNDVGYFLRANGDGQIQWGFGDDVWHEVESESGIQLFELDTWNHVAGVYDGNVQKIYLNGNLIATSDPFSTNLKATPTENLFIGSSPAFPDRVVPGGITEVRVWNIARSDSEIKEFSTQRITGTETGLAAYWPINEGEGQIIFDQTANANDGILGGTTEEDEFDPIWMEGNFVNLIDVLEGFNGSFEDDFMFWRFYEVPNDLGSNNEIINGDVIHGAKAAKITYVDAEDGLVDRSLDNWDSNMPLVPDAEYFGKFWAKSDNPEQGVMRVTHGYFDVDRNVIGEESLTYNLTDEYQEFTFDFVAPENTVTGWLAFRWKGADVDTFASGVIYLDHIQLLTPEIEPEDSTVSVQVLLLGESEQALLQPNFPNPFDQSTTIGFTLPQQTAVNLSVFNIAGEKVAELINGEMAAGTYNTEWNPQSLPHGIYFITLQTERDYLTNKMIYTR